MKAVVVMMRAPHDDGAAIVTVGDRRIGLRGGISAGPPDRGDHQRTTFADVLAAARSVTGAVVRVAVPPGRGADVPAQLGVPASHIVEARGESCGDRLRFAIADLCRRGAKQVVLIAADHPHLTSAHVHDAFAVLDRTPGQVVLGPSTAGGYYLLGLTGPKVPDLFTGVRWHTRYTLHDMLRRCEFEERRVTLLPLLEG